MVAVVAAGAPAMIEQQQQAVHVVAVSVVAVGGAPD